MSVKKDEWLKLIEDEYIRQFVTLGGGVIKFAATHKQLVEPINQQLFRYAQNNGMMYAMVNSAETKLHMIHDLFFAIARQINWAADVQRFVECLCEEYRYTWPKPGERVTRQEIADANNVDARQFERDYRVWLNQKIMKDVSMTQDFRSAILQLCIHVLSPFVEGDNGDLPVLQWLRGELRLINALKTHFIFSKITRHNARAMLRSLCRWMKLAGYKGLLLSVDCQHLSLTNSTIPAGTKSYSPSAVLDACEVMRQLIDDADMFESFLCIMNVNTAFMGEDPKRSIGAYLALKHRIWNDVKAKAISNPLTPLVEITS